jgi:hypothetical protein
MEDRCSGNRNKANNTERQRLQKLIQEFRDMLDSQDLSRGAGQYARQDQPDLPLPKSRKRQVDESREDFKAFLATAYECLPNRMNLSPFGRTLTLSPHRP